MKRKMLCDNCHSSNKAGAKFCAVCGEPLPEEPLVHRQGGAEEPVRVENAYNYNDGYTRERVDTHRVPRQKPSAPPRPVNQYPPYEAENGYEPFNAQPRPKRSVGAIVFYIISGLLALGCMSLPFLPNIDTMQGASAAYDFPGRYLNVSAYAMKLMDTSSSFYYNENSMVMGVIILVMFAVPMIFLLFWAIFSFMRLNAAGGMGLVGSIIYTNIAAYWVIYLLDYVKIGSYYFIDGNGGAEKYITLVPYLMLLFGLTGIIFSSVQLSQRNRIH